MTYKTNWLRGILGPMLVSCTFAAHAVPANISANVFHTAFIDNGAVFAMGYNRYGEIAPATGFEHRAPYFTGILDAKSVSTNLYRTAVLKTDGSIFITGLDRTTWAGAVRTLNVGASDVTLTQQDIYYVAGGTLYRIIGNQPAFAVPGGTNVRHVAGGLDHVVILFNDGTVGTYGKGALGQLGNGTTVEATSVVKLDITSAVEVSAGDYVSAVRTSTGEIFVFGKNDRGYLGTGTTTHQLTPFKIPGVSGAKKVQIAQSTTSYVASDDTLWTAGWHNYIEGNLYNFDLKFVKMPIGTVVDYSAGMDYIIVNRGKVGQLEGWGGNGFGKLGDNSNLEKHQISSAFFTPIAPPPPPPVVAVAPQPEPAPEPAPAPTTQEPVTESAAFNPLAPAPTPVVMEPQPTTTEVIVTAIVNTVVDAVTTVVDAVVAVVDAVVTPIVEAISPTPVPTPTPEPAPVVVQPAPLPVEPVKVKCNNGWGNGDQCAPGKSGSRNNAENNTSGKTSPTAKAQATGKKG